MDLTRAFPSESELKRYGTNSGRWSIMPSMQPSDTAPKAKMEDSLTSQSEENRLSLSRGRRKVSRASWNTFERTSRAAAEHFRRFQSDRASLRSSSSSESSESPSTPPSSSPPCVLALWNRGRMSESLSGTCSSSTSAYRGHTSEGSKYSTNHIILKVLSSTYTITLTMLSYL